MWNMVPPHVLEHVLEKLPFRDALRCRGLSSCWASAVQASIPLEFVICQAPKPRSQNKASEENDLDMQSSRTVSDHRVNTFKLMKLIPVQECSSLLRSLTK